MKNNIDECKSECPEDCELCAIDRLIEAHYESCTICQDEPFQECVEMDRLMEEQHEIARKMFDIE